MGSSSQKYFKKGCHYPLTRMVNMLRQKILSFDKNVNQLLIKWKHINTSCGSIYR